MEDHRPMAAIMTFITTADLEAYVRDRGHGQRDEQLEALIHDDPFARKIFIEALACQKSASSQKP